MILKNHYSRLLSALIFYSWVNLSFSIIYQSMYYKRQMVHIIIRLKCSSNFCVRIETDVLNVKKNLSRQLTKKVFIEFKEYALMPCYFRSSLLWLEKNDIQSEMLRHLFSSTNLLWLEFNFLERQFFSFYQ